MEATLKIRNMDTSPVTVETDNGDGAETIDPGGGNEKELGLRLLTSESFAELMAGGKVRFVEVQNPSKEQYLLARAVLPRLLRSLGGDLVELHGRLQAATGALEKRRRSYNRLWKQTEALLTEAERASPAAEHLFRGVDHFLRLKPENDEVAQRSAELETLQQEDLSQPGSRSFEEWLEEFEAKEEALRRAEHRLEAARRASLEPLEALKEALEKASDRFKTADPGNDVGSEVPAFP